MVIQVLGYKPRSWQFPKARFVNHPSIQIEELMACKSGSIGLCGTQAGLMGHLSPAIAGTA